MKLKSAPPTASPSAAATAAASLGLARRRSMCDFQYTESLDTLQQLQKTVSCSSTATGTETATATGTALEEEEASASEFDQFDQFDQHNRYNRYNQYDHGLWQGLYQGLYRRLYSSLYQNSLYSSLYQRLFFGIQHDSSTDAESYMSKREMTRTQERWNALTVVPNPLYCLYFILAGLWVPNAPDDGNITPISHTGHTATIGRFHHADCYTPTWWHAMPSKPPACLWWIFAGIALHAPFSFAYHWRYATSLTASARVTHWSRRMDQAMILVASTCLTASLCIHSHNHKAYLCLATALNIDGIRNQFQTKVNPRRNQRGIFLSMVGYTLPMLLFGGGGGGNSDPSSSMETRLTLFVELWAVMVLAGWLFVRYPVGGWSHAVFHIVVAAVPPLMMRASLQLYKEEFSVGDVFATNYHHLHPHDTTNNDALSTAAHCADYFHALARE